MLINLKKAKFVQEKNRKFEKILHFVLSTDSIYYR